MKKSDKNNVYKAYNDIIDWFDAHRNKELEMERAYLDLIASHINSGASVLDVGCGTGEPIAKYFIEHGYKLHGIDASEAMIKRCRDNFPSAEWTLADMRNINLDKQYALVIAWHSLFHLPHDDQRQTLSKLISHVQDGGLLIFTSGPEYSEMWADNGGYELYHASLSAEEYEKIIIENGLSVIVHNVRDPNCGEATVWVAARTQDKTIK